MARANNKKAVRPDGKMAKRCVSEEALRDAIATTQRRYRRNINVLALVGAVAAFAALRLPTPTEPETFDADASLRTRAEPGEFGWVEADASHVRVREIRGRRRHEVDGAVALRPGLQKGPRAGQGLREAPLGQRRGDRRPVALEERVDAQRRAELKVFRGVARPRLDAREGLGVDVDAAGLVDELRRLARVEGHVRADHVAHARHRESKSEFAFVTAALDAAGAPPPESEAKDDAPEEAEEEDDADEDDDAPCVDRGEPGFDAHLAVLDACRRGDVGAVEGRLQERVWAREKFEMSEARALGPSS